MTKAHESQIPTTIKTEISMSPELTGLATVHVRPPRNYFGQGHLPPNLSNDVACDLKNLIAMGFDVLPYGLKMRRISRRMGGDNVNIEWECSTWKLPTLEDTVCRIHAEIEEHRNKLKMQLMELKQQLTSSGPDEEFAKSLHVLERKIRAASENVDDCKARVEAHAAVIEESERMMS